VFDLRENPAACWISAKVASRYPKAPIRSLDEGISPESLETMDHLDADQRPTSSHRFPFVVLVNGNSASVQQR